MAYCDYKNQVILLNSAGEKKVVEPAKNNIFPEGGRLRIVTSSRSKERDVKGLIEQIYPQSRLNYSVETVSSAVKFFYLFEDRADINLGFSDTKEWDIAPGQAIVNLLGGSVKKVFFEHDKIFVGDELDYKKPDFSNPYILSFITKPPQD